MIIKCQLEKKHPMTDVTAEIIPGQPTETESGFIFPLVMPIPDGKQIVVATIECSRLDVEKGVQKIAVNATQYTNGELSEPRLLNHILIDFKEFVPPTDENEIVLTAVTTPTPKTKAS